MASARLAKFRWTRGEPFTATLFLLDDAPRAISLLRITARLERADGSESIALGEWLCPGTSANTYSPEPLANLVLEVADHPKWSSHYTVALTENSGQGNATSS
jgi:hypothetical protein